MSYQVAFVLSILQLGVVLMPVTLEVESLSRDLTLLMGLSGAGLDLSAHTAYRGESNILKIQVGQVSLDQISPHAHGFRLAW